MAQEFQTKAMTEGARVLPPYSRVKLVSDRHRAEGALPGMLGYVIEVYPDGKYEVELSNPDGATIAQVVVEEAEVDPSPEPPKSPR